MASQGPVNVSSGSLLKDLTTFEPSKFDTERTCFPTKRKVQIVAGGSFPIFLAGLATLISSLLFPPITLIAAGCFLTLGAVASATYLYFEIKPLLSRKVRHVGVLPYINHHKVVPSQRNTLPINHPTQPTGPRQTPPVGPLPAPSAGGFTPSTGNHKKTPIQPQPVPIRESTSPTVNEPAPTPPAVQIPTGKEPVPDESPRLSSDNEMLLTPGERINEQPEPTNPDNSDSSSDSGISGSTTPSSQGLSDDLSDAYNVSPFSISPAHSVNEDMIITMPGTSLPGRPDTPGNSSDNWETSSVSEVNPYSVPPLRERRGAETPETEDSNASFQSEGVSPGAFSATDIEMGPLSPRSAAEVGRNMINQQLTRQTTSIHSLSDESAISAPQRSTSDRDSSHHTSPVIMPESTDDEDDGNSQGSALTVFRGSVTPLQSQGETGLSEVEEDNTSVRSERPVSIEQTKPGSTLFSDENGNGEAPPLISQTSDTTSSYSVDQPIRHTESPQQAPEEPATGSIESPLSDEDSTHQNSPVLLGNLAETEDEQINPEPVSGSLPGSFRPIPIQEEINLSAIEEGETSFQSEIPTSAEQTSSNSSLFAGENSEAVYLASHSPGTARIHSDDQHISSAESFQQAPEESAAPSLEHTISEEESPQPFFPALTNDLTAGEGEHITPEPAPSSHTLSESPVRSLRDIDLSEAEEDNTSVRSERAVSIEQARPGRTLFPDENENGEAAPLISQTSGTVSSHNADQSIRHTDPQQAPEESATPSLEHTISEEESSQSFFTALTNDLTPRELEHITPKPAPSSHTLSESPVRSLREIDLSEIEEYDSSIPLEKTAGVEQATHSLFFAVDENSEALSFAYDASVTQSTYIADLSTGHSSLPQQPSVGETTSQSPEVVATSPSDSDSRDLPITPESIDFGVQQLSIPSPAGCSSTALTQEAFESIEAPAINRASVATSDISEASLAGRLSVPGNTSDNHELSEFGSNSDLAMLFESQSEAEAEDNNNSPLPVLLKAKQSTTPSPDYNEDTVSLASSSPGKASKQTVNQLVAHHQSTDTSLIKYLNDELESTPELAGSSTQQKSAHPREVSFDSCKHRSSAFSDLKAEDKIRHTEPPRPVSEESATSSTLECVFSEEKNAHHFFPEVVDDINAGEDEPITQKPAAGSLPRSVSPAGSLLESSLSVIKEDDSSFTSERSISVEQTRSESSTFPGESSEAVSFTFGSSDTASSDVADQFIGQTLPPQQPSGEKTDFQVSEEGATEPLEDEDTDLTTSGSTGFRTQQRSNFSELISEASLGQETFESNNACADVTTKSDISELPLTDALSISSDTSHDHEASLALDSSLDLTTLSQQEKRVGIFEVEENGISFLPESLTATEQAGLSTISFSEDTNYAGSPAYSSTDEDNIYVPAPGLAPVAFPATRQSHSLPTTATEKQSLPARRAQSLNNLNDDYLADIEDNDSTPCTADSDSDLFTSVPETSKETSVELFAYDSQPGQPELAHSQPALSKLEPVRQQEDPARASTPIEKQLLSVEEAHISQTPKAPKGNLTKPAPIQSDKTVLAQSPSLAHEQTLNVTAETVEEIPDHQLPEAINAIVTEQAATHSAPSDKVVASPVPTLALEQPLNATLETVDPLPEFERPKAMQPNVTEFYQSKQPVESVLPILTDPTADIGKQPVPVRKVQADEQVDVYEGKATKTIEIHPKSDESAEEVPSTHTESLAHDGTHSLPEPDFISGVSNTIRQSYSLPAFLGEKPRPRDRRALSLDGLNCGYLADIEDHSSDNSPTDSDPESNTCLINQQIHVAESDEYYEQADGMESEEKAQAFLTMLSTENDTLTSPEPDLESRLFTTTEQSHSLPTYTGAKQPSPVRSAFSLNRLSHGHWADMEYSSSDTTPLLSPTASDVGLANRQTNVFSGADHPAPDQLGAMTPHLFDPAVSKNKTSLDDKHKRVRGHASDPELTTQRKERLSGDTIPEQIAPHLPELSEFSSFGSFCITDAQELVSEPDSIDDSDMDDWEDLRDCAQELKPFKQELEDAINKPLVLLEYLAHQLAYNLDGKSQVELPGHTDGNQRHNVQKVQEVPPGLNAYILYPENSDTGKPVDLKIIFRGTNPYDASAIRDLEPSGAGFDTMEKAAKSITRQLHNILKHYPGRAVNLTITGHSLGGADAQNFFGHLHNPDISAIANETLTATPLLANIQKITLFTKCSAGVPEITHNRVISALSRLNGQKEQTGIKTEIFHLKVEGDIVQATGDCHVGSSLEQEIADVSILQIYPSNEASRVDRHTKKFFTDDANLAPIYWYKWMKNTTDKGMEDIRRSVRNTSRILRSYPIKGVQWAIHSAANYWFTPSEAMAETAVLKDTTIAEQPEESTPFTSIRTESGDISVSHPASLVTRSSAETLKEDQKNEATIGTGSKKASINNESSEVHLEDTHPIKTKAYVNESDSDQISDVEHSPLLAISLPRGRKQKKLRLQNIIPPQLRKRPKSDLAIARAYDMSICYRLALCANEETQRKDIKPYDRDNNIKIDFIRRMLVDEQSFVRACDPYNVIRDINADIEEEAKAEKRFRYSILAKAEVTDKSLRGEAFRDATRPVSEQAYWNFMARCQDDHSNTLDEESEPNKGVFKYSLHLINKLACFNNEFGQIEHNFNQFLFKKELSTDDQKRLRSLLKRAGKLQKHAESCYLHCEQHNLEQKTIENILSKAVGSDSQNRQCRKLQKIQEGIRGKLNEKPQSDTPEVQHEIAEADNEPVEPTIASAYADLQSENNLLTENNAHDTDIDDAETGVKAEVDDVISLAGDMSFDLSSDDPLLSEDENDLTKQPDSLTDEQKLALMQHQDNTGLQQLSLTDDDKLVISSADIPSATAMMGLYSDAQKALDDIHEQGKHREDANDIIKDVSRYMSTIQEYFPVEAFSLQAPPADAVREKMYSQLVDLGARYLILTTQPEASSRRTNYGKEELGISTEFLWQTQKAWKSASPDLINGQVAAMLAIGLMKPEQKTFVFEVCLNTQIISLEDIRRNIEQLKNKQDELSDRLKNTVSESNDQMMLNERLLDIQDKLTTFEAQYTDLRLKESSGMKNQKDFLDCCYSQLTHQLQEDISQGVEKYLRKYQKEYKKKPAEEIKKIKQLSKSVIADSGPILRRKAKEYANETSRKKENEEKGIRWETVKDERLKMLKKAVALLIDAEVLRQLCASDVGKACKVFSPDVISQLFNDQELTFNERSLPHIDSLNFFQILAENEKVDLMAEKKREDVNHQVQKDIEREAFSCHLKTADNTQSAFTHNDYLQEKSQLKAAAFDGESPSEANLVQKSSARVLEKLTTAFKGLLKEAGVEEGVRMERLITTMLAHSHQGAYALHQGISEVIQSKLSLVIDAYLPKASHLDEMGPPRLVFPDQPSRKSNATLEIAKDVKGNNILLLSKVFEWDINLHDRELSPIPDARRRLRVETVYEVGLVEGCVKVRSINTSEVQPLDG